MCFVTESGKFCFKLNYLLKTAPVLSFSSKSNNTKAGAQIKQEIS